MSPRFVRRWPILTLAAPASAMAIYKWLGFLVLVLAVVRAALWLRGRPRKHRVRERHLHGRGDSAGTAIRCSAKQVASHAPGPCVNCGGARTLKVTGDESSLLRFDGLLLTVARTECARCHRRDSYYLEIVDD